MTAIAPEPVESHSALARAQQKGAAALFVVLAIPGNMSFVSHVQGLSNNPKLPVFTVGLDDGEAVEALNARIASLATQRGGSVESVDIWGRKRLAYPIKRFRDGVYILSRLKLPPASAAHAF